MTDDSEPTASTPPAPAQAPDASSDAVTAAADDEEHVEVIRKTVAQVAGKVPVIAGTGANATAEAVALTQAAKEAGADAALLVTVLLGWERLAFNILLVIKELPVINPPWSNCLFSLN